MLSNILDVDFESMLVSLRCERGALILFDFSAFPSISHDYLLTVMEAVGVPPSVMNFVRAIYCGTG